MRFTTLHEQLEHDKQCKDWDAKLSDETKLVHCYECDFELLKCETITYHFKTNQRAHTYCRECFKSNKGT